MQIFLFLFSFFSFAFFFNFYQLLLDFLFLHFFHSHFYLPFFSILFILFFLLEKIRRNETQKYRNFLLYVNRSTENYIKKILSLSFIRSFFSFLLVILHKRVLHCDSESNSFLCNAWKWWNYKNTLVAVTRGIKSVILPHVLSMKHYLSIHYSSIPKKKEPRPFNFP